VQMDAGGQLPEEIPYLIAPVMRGDAEVVFGSDFLAGSSVEPGSIRLLNRIANLAGSSMSSAVCGTKTTDIMARFKAFPMDALREIDFMGDSFAYEPELRF